MPDNNSSSLGSMDDISDVSDAGSAANVTPSSKNKQQHWGSNDQAENLLADISSLLGDEAEKEEESVRRELEAKADAKVEAKAEEERQRRYSGDQRLKAERDRQLENEKNRDMIAAAIEREEKIKRGEIDVEEEARLKKEEEEKLATEARAKAKDEAALSDAQKLIQAQQSELRRLSEFNMPAIQQAEPIQIKSNPAPIIVSVILLLALVGGGVWFMTKQQPTPSTAPIAAVDGVLFASADGAIVIENIESYPSDLPSIDKHNTSVWRLGSTGGSDSSAAPVTTARRKSSKSRRSGRKKRDAKKKGGLTGFKKEKGGKGSVFNRGE